ncbi:MAG: hypothetical protein ABI592_04140 [Acidobacteriota bacterium]
MSSAAPTERTPRAAGRLLLLSVFAIPFLAYLAGLHSVGSGDTRPAELLPISILESGNLDFNEFVKPGEPLPYWFHRFGPRVVSIYPILPGILNVPAYAAARALGVPILERQELLSLLTASAIAALSVLCVYLALLELKTTRAAAIRFAFAYAFGTCVWSVASRGLWQHGPATLFLSAGLWLVCRRNGKGAGWAGAAMALAVLCRPSALLLAAPLAAAFAWRRPGRLLRMALGAAIPAALHVGYCAAYLGTPWSSGFWNPFPEVSNFSGKPLPGLAGLLVSPSRGLLVFSPFLLFAIPGILRGLRSRDRRALTIAMASGCAATIGLYAFWTTWWAGHSFGYRFLIELTPFLTVLAAFWWEESSRAGRTVFRILLAWSVYVQFLGAEIHPSGFNELLDKDPGVLWSLRDSEIAISTRKLIARLAGF